MSKQQEKQLTEPFDVESIGWKINNYIKNDTMAMITFHIDARNVQERLNDVFGIAGWSFEWTEARMDGVHGRLTVSVDDRQVVKEDVGYPNSVGKDQQDKDAVSDALKRCAVHLGIGHFLYSLPKCILRLEKPRQKYLTDTQNAALKKWITMALAGQNVSTFVDAGGSQEPTKTPPQQPKRAAPPRQQTPAARQSGSNAPCAECHAPAGKPHGSNCSLA